MEWFGNFFIVYGALAASLALGYLLLNWRFRNNGYNAADGPFHQSNWPKSAAFSVMPYVLALFCAVMLTVILNSPYRMIPSGFFWFWGAILVGINLWVAISMWYEPWGKRTAAAPFHFVHLGGVWGNHGKKNDPRWPGVTHNAWGWFNIAFWLITFVSFNLHGTSWTFEATDVIQTVKSETTVVVDTAKGLSDEIGLTKVVEAAVEEGKGLVEQAKERYKERLLGKFLKVVQPDPPTPSASVSSQPPVLSVYPRSDSWFWMLWLVTIWAIYANIRCHLDGALALVDVVIGWFKKPKRQSEVIGVTEVSTAPGASEKEKPGKPEKKEPLPKEAQMGRILVKEAFAEGAVEGVQSIFNIVKNWIRPRPKR